MRFNCIFGKIQNLMRFNGLNKIKESILVYKEGAVMNNHEL
jgi:hypothetical protein